LAFSALPLLLEPKGQNDLDFVDAGVTCLDVAAGVDCCLDGVADGVGAERDALAGTGIFDVSLLAVGVAGAASTKRHECETQKQH
jgi:hypothetical protein